MFSGILSNRCDTVTWTPLSLSLSLSLCLSHFLTQTLKLSTLSLSLSLSLSLCLSHFLTHTLKLSPSISRSLSLSISLSLYLYLSLTCIHACMHARMHVTLHFAYTMCSCVTQHPCTVVKRCLLQALAVPRLFFSPAKAAELSFQVPREL